MKNSKIDSYILAVATISMIFNVGYIVHELGWYPHTKNRKSPADRKFRFNSNHDKDRQETHRYKVASPFTMELRKLGHADVYSFKDPYEALQNVMKRYEENPTRSRYDDLFNLSNFISNTVRSDQKINELIERATELPFSKPYKN